MYVTNACMSMLRDKAPFIQKMRFPRILLIFAVGWTNLIVFSLHMIVFIVFAQMFGVHLTLAALYLPILLVQMTLFSLGIGMLLSSYVLRFQDIRHLWDVVLQILFWLTPITYPIFMRLSIAREAWLSLTPGNVLPWGLLHTFITLQPLSVILYDLRRILLYPSEGVPSVPHILVFTLLYAIIFAFAASVFIRRSKNFLQEY